MILVFIFLLFIIGLFFSKVSAYIKSYCITNNYKELESKYIVKLKFWWFGIIPIIIISLREDELRLYNLRINYKKILNNKILKKRVTKVRNNFKISRIKLLKPKLKKLDLNLTLGTNSVELTSFLVMLLSVILSYWLNKKIKAFSETKYKYMVKPNYNEGNNIYLNFMAVINVKTSNIIECIK